MSVWGWSEAIAATLLSLVILSLLMLFVRRRALSKHAMFDCAMRLKQKTPGTGWVLGVARYRGDTLEWFRIFSLSWRPKRRFCQRDWRTISQRCATSQEQSQFFVGQEIITLECARTGERCELAADAGSLTGLRSWLEASVPLAR